MKTCRGCSLQKTMGSFYCHSKMADGHLNFCKECVKTRVRGHYDRTLDERHAYEANRNMTQRRKEQLQESSVRSRAAHPDRYRARTAVGNAVRDGRLVKEPCALCGSTERVEGHHHDYAKPLDVTWECFKCHREQEHGQVVTCMLPSVGMAA